jgi:hypothetical protein
MIDTAKRGHRAPTRDEVISIVGAVGENKVAALLASGARAKDLIDAIAMARGEIDIAATGESAISPLAVEAYEILTNDTMGASA